MKRQLSCLSITLALGLGLILGLIWLIAAPSESTLAQASTDLIRVSDTHPGSTNTDGCGSEITPCLTIQYAVGQAQPGQEIRIAAGTYDDLSTYDGHDQVVYVTETLTLRGGYTTTLTGWITPDVDANPTMIDAGGQGRALYISGDITVTVEGLNLTAGDATGQGTGGERGRGGGVYASGATTILSDCAIYDNTGSTSKIAMGGGLYAVGVTLTLSGCAIYDNIASITKTGHGGGLYAHTSSANLTGNLIYSNTAALDGDGKGGGLWLGWTHDLTLTGNEVLSNTASSGAKGFGGGIYVEHCSATLHDNTVKNNVASSAGTGEGGGLCFDHNDIITLAGNTVLRNTASTTAGGDGGGLFFDHSDFVTLAGNTAQSNTASSDGVGIGGGLFIDHSIAVTLTSNTVLSNTASSGAEGDGGGLYLANSAAISLTANTVLSNTASSAGLGEGGGLYLNQIDEGTLSSNNIASNTATVSATAEGLGGGLYTQQYVTITLINNMITRNQANSQGSGLYFAGSSGQLLHNTIADNSAAGSGVYAGDNTTLALTNTILSGHPAVAILVTSTGTATLEASLWYANGTNTGGSGTIVTGTVNIVGNPAFVDPPNGDYHLTLTSAALDSGIDAGIPVDYDGEPRPAGNHYDIGADEVPGDLLWGVQLVPDRAATALPLSIIVYTHTLTNTGSIPTTFDLSHASSPGWIVAYETPITLGVGATATLPVSVTVPAAAPSGTVETTIVTAAVQVAPTYLDAVTDTTTVARLFAVQLAPDYDQMVPPGTIITYSHILTNTGNWTDTFDLSVASSQGWSASYSTAITLSAWETASLFVSVTVPLAAPIGVSDTTVLTAATQAAPTVSDTATDATTVALAGVQLSPGRAETVPPGTILTYTHILTNTGSISDTFALTLTSSLGWSSIDGTPRFVSAGHTTTLLVHSTVPTSATLGLVDIAILTATSTWDPAIFATATNTTTAGIIPSALPRVYLPMVLKNH